MAYVRNIVGGLLSLSEARAKALLSSSSSSTELWWAFTESNSRDMLGCRKEDEISSVPVGS